MLGRIPKRFYTTPSSPGAPRHLLSISDLTPQELTWLVQRSHAHKTSVKASSGRASLPPLLATQTLALMFNKRSTRTRVSCESAITRLAGHPMFLSPLDIQLGVNESLRDTSTIISSMTAGMIARVAAHSDIEELAQWSSVPVINALSDDWHPLQSLADFLTMWEILGAASQTTTGRQDGLGLEGLKIAWVGDANNVLFDLVSASLKLGAHVSAACPKGYGIPAAMRERILKSKNGVSSPGSLSETDVPEEAIRDANIIVTDTWISMGWEAETQERLKAFEGFQVTEELARRGGANADWKFMHCLPRHQEEVSDEVFYGPRSLVFQEGENRLWTTIGE